jgi:hypothetical protein
VRIYLASALQNAPRVHSWALALDALGVDVVSTWHAQALRNRETKDPPGSGARARVASQCLEDLRRARRFIYFDSPFVSRGGLWEFGYAFGRMPCTWVCNPHDTNRNVFCSLSAVGVVYTDKGLLASLGL